MTRTVLHVGPHKTGTTYLQQSLALNREKLLAAGIYYPSELVGQDITWCHVGLVEALKKNDRDSLIEAIERFQAPDHDVVVLSRHPTGTDPSTHPTSDDVSEGVRVIAAAQDPHEFSFGTDMMAWTLAMGHSMVRAGLNLKKQGSGRPWRPDVVHAHDWLVAHPAVALAQFYDVQAGNSRAQGDGEQFGVLERGGSVAQQPLPGTLVFWRLDGQFHKRL